MVSIYKMTNDANNHSVKTNERLIFKTLKALKVRNPNLCKDWIELWEELEGKKFDWSYVE